MRNLRDLIERLPPDLQEEVGNFAEFLLEKRVGRPRRKLKLDWAGGLREYRGRYTSLDLQKKALEWRGD